MPPLPPPLPPAERTAGQLVAETVRFYGRRFWAVLPLGTVVAAADVIALELSVRGRIVLLLAFAPLFTAAYLAACRLVLDVRPGARRALVALAVGTAVFAPAAALFPWFALAAVAWLGLAGLVVPVAAAEGLGPLSTVRRALALARVDLVHAIGSLAALVLVFGLTRTMLGLLLRDFGDQTIRAAIALADLVLAPILFVGPALLYLDQAARASVVRSGSRKRVRRSA